MGSMIAHTWSWSWAQDGVGIDLNNVDCHGWFDRECRCQCICKVNHNAVMMPNGEWCLPETGGDYNNNGVNWGGGFNSQYGPWEFIQNGYEVFNYDCWTEDDCNNPCMARCNNYCAEQVSGGPCTYYTPEGGQ